MQRVRGGHNPLVVTSRSRATQPSSAVGTTTMDESWILFAEAGGVLCLVLLLVWWTLRGKK